MVVGEDVVVVEGELTVELIVGVAHLATIGRRLGVDRVIGVGSVVISVFAPALFVVVLGQTIV